MAAVLGLDSDAVRRACEEAAQGEIVAPASLNASGQVVIAGTRGAVERAGARARELGAKRVVPLAVSAPFHCALMKPAEERLAPELRALQAQNPRVPVIANVDAAPKRDHASAVEALIRQISSAVRWEESVRRLASEGVTAYVEVGPGSVLSALIQKIQREAETVAVGTPADVAAVRALLSPAA
jgi:[acyl-carrier-protein] S-malonyltransferase